jgi:acetyl-CoA carboxylase biotin carboxyl carrier protein
MNLDTLKEIVKVAKDQGVAELQVEGKDYKVSVSFMTSAAPVVHHAPVAHHAPAPQAAPAAAAPAKAAASDAGLHIIKSPFVGTFYGSPSPGKPNYVKVGDKVRAGQPLCVLEAMKIMNEIQAEAKGTIVEILVENGQPVEYGQKLFRLKKS